MNIIYGILTFCLAWLFALVFTFINAIVVVKLVDYLEEKIDNE